MSVLRGEIIAEPFFQVTDLVVEIKNTLELYSGDNCIFNVIIY